MTVSIIIAVKELNDNLKLCLSQCLNLNYSDFEIIVLPDELFSYQNDRVRIIPTGNTTPPKKRDLSLQEVKGEILAFIDDDAYPDSNWLKNAVGYFLDDKVGAVCGPAVTAPNQRLRQKASGVVYESFLVSGSQLFRYKPLTKRNVIDYPTCNLLVRTSVMKQLGGFNTNFWPGEDTFLCSGITEKLKKKIIYDPTVLVYHQRRALFLPHLKQIANYAIHRGYFVKKRYNNSLKIFYFLPSILLLAIVIGVILQFFIPSFRQIFLLGIILYLSLVLLFSFSREWGLILLKFLGIISTHLVYGFLFIVGLLSKKMKEEI